MSSNNSLVIHLYWGGKIVYVGGSMSYDPPVPKKVMFLRERAGFDELVDRAYNITNLDRNKYKISLIFRTCLHYGVFGAMPLMDDNGVDGMYFLKANSGHATEIYMEVEELLSSGRHDTQTLQIANPRTDGGTSVCGKEPMNTGGTASLFKSQSTQLDSGDAQPTRRGCRRRHQVETDRPSGSRQAERMSIVEPRDLETTAATVFEPTTNTDVEFVDVDVDSEPEPDADDDHNYDASEQRSKSGEGGISLIHVEPSAPCTIDVTPQLRYEAGVDATLRFDPLDVRGGVEKLKFWNEHAKELQLGHLFHTKEHVKRAVKLWSIKKNREYKVRESTPTTWYVRCKARNSTPSCNWQLRATLRSSHKLWMIVTLADEHTCVRPCNGSDHRHLSEDIIAEYIIPHVINDPFFKVKKIQTMVKKELHCNVSYKKAWSARRRAMNIINGD
ncbi:uncharacterized protein [Coffea arabica]|uniref:Transposase MuDR plant domain-containing protein n=1 Tax=Coffea arabica TaxID=13443 RepID=A0A6P6SYX1_COFAR|nr:uncharacterized protein LOC113695897 [Coffea arabica]